jgi:hypothetical protein
MGIMDVEYRTFLNEYSVSSKTLEGYRSTWERKWVPFLGQRGDTLDHFLVGVPSDRVGVIIAEFMMFLSIKHKTRAGTANSALAGVKHFLGLHNPATLREVPEQSSLLRKTKAALANLDHARLMEGSTVARGDQSPFTYNMVEWLRKRYWDDPLSTLESEMTYLGIVVGFNGLMRESELLYKRPSKAKNSKGRWLEELPHSQGVMSPSAQTGGGMGFCPATPARR